MKTLLLGTILLACAGCGDGEGFLCPDPYAPCASPDAGATPPPPPTCAGACLPPPADGWSAPVLLWIGSPDQVPACPPQAPHDEYDGHADPDQDPLACGACTCAPPEGTCGPPGTLTANGSACKDVGLGVSETPFVTPVESACAAGAPLPACSGTCARSITFPALSVQETGCLPVLPPPPPRPPTLRDPQAPLSSVTWKTAARACTNLAPPACPAAGSVCAPGAASGFLTCTKADGDVPCAAGFPVRHVFFHDADDTRGCSGCACGAPAGSLCTGSVSIYADAACTVALDMVGVASSAPVCLDVEPSSAPLGSAEVSALTYQPGTCAPSGGAPGGTVTPTGPTTFCCRP